MIAWKEITGFPRYHISDTGVVLNIKTQRKLLPATHRHNGAQWIVLQCHGERTNRSIHSLVLEHFVCPRPKGAVCRHLDGNPANNLVGNLAWGSMKENAQDCERHGRRARLEKNGRARLTCGKAAEIRVRFARGTSVSELARLYDINPGAISKLVRGITWRMPPS